MMNPQKKAYLFALSAIACWSTIGSAFKISLRYTSPPGLLFFSSLVACLVLFFILVVQRKLSLLRKLTRREILWSAFLGLLNPFLYYSVLLEAYDLLRAQEAGTLNYIWPLVLVLLSIPMLRQKISFVSILAISVSFIGIILISSHPGSEGAPGGAGHILGVGLAVGSAVLWALYWIFNVKDQREAVSKLFLNFCFGLLYTFTWLAVSGQLHLPVWQGITGSIYIGLFEMGITFVLWLYALEYSSTTAKVSNLIYLSPFISLVIIHFTVGETILPSTVFGLLLIVTGIVMQQYLKR
jgi:drug/metabolite transporter (DMT)-like permease